MLVASAFVVFDAAPLVAVVLALVVVFLWVVVSAAVVDGGDGAFHGAVCVLLLLLPSSVQGDALWFDLQVDGHPIWALQLRGGGPCP